MVGVVFGIACALLENINVPARVISQAGVFLIRVTKFGQALSWLTRSTGYQGGGVIRWMVVWFDSSQVSWMRRCVCSRDTRNNNNIVASPFFA